jgi:hypothetical protein
VKRSVLSAGALLIQPTPHKAGYTAAGRRFHSEGKAKCKGFLGADPRKSISVGYMEACSNRTYREAFPEGEAYKSIGAQAVSSAAAAAAAASGAATACTPAMALGLMDQ